LIFDFIPLRGLEEAMFELVPAKVDCDSIECQNDS